MAKEGSLDAPTRHPILWQDEDYSDLEQLQTEAERQFDVCHGCRRCFNLCGSFPKLFDLIDDSDSGELDSVDKNSYEDVVDECTLCDMCYMTKCPYVPPHEFNIDFPHLMLRYKAYQYKNNKVNISKKILAESDIVGKISTTFAPVVNRLNASQTARNLLEKVIKVDQMADLPKYSHKTLIKLIKEQPLQPNPSGVALGESVLLYPGCFCNYNDVEMGYQAYQILSFFGVNVKMQYDGCCGMPHLENGNIEKVYQSSLSITQKINAQNIEGDKVVCVVPSCSLMMKKEWPLIAHDHQDVQLFSQNVEDFFEYLVVLIKKYGIPSILSQNEEIQKITLHLACHSRAQNMGAKAAEFFRLISNIQVSVIERCSGHGGIWGFLKKNFNSAIKFAKPVVRQIKKEERSTVSSECPLALSHIHQAFEKLSDLSEETMPIISKSPIKILADLLGL